MHINCSFGSMVRFCLFLLVLGLLAGSAIAS
ncbi:hypothetical protein H4W32_003883 [Actinophytocola algeriensis]|uniref:Uncharacterized protein n=1 Tax=Actinophytocola algeriensis TaxID=1768010 RepID=A0A7W7QB00_9PSEU|nr:hypothetical protein [Actinophytocola algeriensis]MBE1475841.1 hypothetical protein [Actinophytocola algeriensis]